MVFDSNSGSNTGYPERSFWDFSSSLNLLIFLLFRAQKSARQIEEFFFYVGDLYLYPSLPLYFHITLSVLLELILMGIK
jgi:hypothetical protein